MGKVVNQTELAEILGVSDVTLWQWQKEGMPIQERNLRGQSNSYDSAMVIQWMVDRAVKKVREESPRDMLYREQTELVKLQIAEKRGALVAVHEVEEKFERLVVHARQRLLQLPPLLHGRLEPAALAQLEEAIHGALKELASYEPSTRDDHQGGEGPGTSVDQRGGEEVGAAVAPVGGGVGGGEEVPEREVPVSGEVRPLKDPVSS